MKTITLILCSRNNQLCETCVSRIHSLSYLLDSYKNTVSEHSYIAARPCDNYNVPLILASCYNAFNAVNVHGDVAAWAFQLQRLNLSHWAKSSVLLHDAPCFLLFLQCSAFSDTHLAQSWLETGMAHSSFQSLLCPLSFPVHVSPSENTCILLPIFKRDTHQFHPYHTSDFYHDPNICR